MNYEDGTSMESDKKLNSIMLALLIEHICSYFIQFFRSYDIATNGQQDIQGVPQAKRESALANIQYVFVCLIVGFSIKQLVILDEKEWNRQLHFILWIIVDSFIMLF